MKIDNPICLPRSRATWTLSFCPVLSRKCTLQPSVSTSIHLWRPGEGGTLANTPAWPTRVRFRWTHLVSHSFGFKPSEKAVHRTHSLQENNHPCEQEIHKLKALSRCFYYATWKITVPVQGADAGAGGAKFTSRALEAVVVADTGATETVPSARTNLFVLRKTRLRAERALARLTAKFWVTLARPADAPAVPWESETWLRSFVSKWNVMWNMFFKSGFCVLPPHCCPRYWSQLKSLHSQNSP